MEQEYLNTIKNKPVHELKSLFNYLVYFLRKNLAEFPLESMKLVMKALLVNYLIESVLPSKKNTFLEHFSKVCFIMITGRLLLGLGVLIILLAT